jgi:hypothetical protein
MVEGSLPGRIQGIIVSIFEWWMMNVLLKRILIAAGLFIFCAAVFAGVKSYGVWVITGVAVVLFIVGLLRKEKPAGPEGRDETHDRDGER